MNKTVFHALNAGDCIYSLPGLQHLYRAAGHKSDYVQLIDRYAYYYEGAEHPVKDYAGEQVNFNDEMFALMSPLLSAQSYINSYKKFDGEKVDYDFHKIRQDMPIDMQHTAIYHWMFYAYPELWCDTSEPWLHVPFNEWVDKIVRGRVIISFTRRYRNMKMTYYFLKKYQPHLLFIGTEDEAVFFKRMYKLPDLLSLVPDNFLEAAQAINQAAFFMGNQSLMYALAEAQKSPRMLEVSPQFPNVPPCGKNGYGYQFQFALEQLFKMMCKKEMEEPKLETVAQVTTTRIAHIGRADFWKQVEDGRWEPHTFATIDKYVTSGSSFVDLGAWVGAFSIYAAKKGAKVYAVEPDEVAMAEMKENIKANNVDVVLSSTAIANDEGVVHLNTNGSFGNSESSLLGSMDVKDSRTVRTEALEQFISRNKIANISLIKIDIEGAEKYVLPQARGWISDNKPIMHISFHPDRFVETDYPKMMYLFDIYDVVSDGGSMVTADNFRTILNQHEHAMVFSSKS